MLDAELLIENILQIFLNSSVPCIDANLGELTHVLINSSKEIVVLG